MSRLSDTQLIILSAACAREDRRVLPLPKSLRGGAAAKVIDALIVKGLVEEVDASSIKGAPVWREDDGRKLTLVATQAADAALDGGATDVAPAAPQRPTKAKTGRKAATAQSKTSKARKAAPTPAKAKVRDGTKQTQLIAMLKRAKGASITEISEALGWQHHTVRGALAGDLKKKLGLTITSEPKASRGRIYRITD
jgi:hypothetical protein